MGAGIDVALGGNIDLFVDGRYVVGFTEGESTQIFPVRAGIKRVWH
jgi:hypothetical protein